MQYNSNVINLLKTSNGQLNGIIKMDEGYRHCTDISKQILSVQALLRKANLSIIENHIRSCVNDAILYRNYDVKFSEVMDIVSKYAK